MKIEEVDLICLKDILKPGPHLKPVFTVSDIQILERKVLEVLKFKLLPDTLNFWFDLAVKLWDLFVVHDGSQFGCRTFKPQSTDKI